MNNVSDGGTEFDSEAIKRLNQLGGMNLVRKMFGLFLENVGDRINDAQSGCDSGDLEQVEKAVHSIRSSAGNLGAVGLQRLSEEIENLASERTDESLDARLTELKSMFERAGEYLVTSIERLENEDHRPD